MRCKSKSAHWADIAISIMVIDLMLLFTGCSARDLEDRYFPQAMEVELLKDTLQGGFGEYLVEGDTVRDMIENYQAKNEKYLDLGHVKVLVLGKRLLNDQERLKTVLQEMNTQPILARNILVVSYGYEKEESCLKKLEEKGIVPGEYLSDLYKNNPEHRRNATATLGEVIAAII